jgi:hypothetical protein
MTKIVFPLLLVFITTTGAYRPPFGPRPFYYSVTLWKGNGLFVSFYPVCKVAGRYKPVKCLYNGFILTLLDWRMHRPVHETGAQ